MKFIEDESAPAMGTSEAPPSPDASDGGGETHNDSRVLNKELGISDEDAAEVDRTKTFLCHDKLEFPGGIVVPGPTDVSLEPIEGGMFQLTVLSTNIRKITRGGYDMDPKEIKLSELTKKVDKKFVDAIKAQGWGAGGGGMGGAPPMGGMGGDPMGGGMGGPPPMGGPPMMAHTEYPSFADWMQLRETGTTTADVAGFSRISIPMVRRIYPNLITFGKKKKPYMQPQVED